MKNIIFILSPLLLTFLIYFASCCKEDICVNKLAGKYKCDVSGYSYSSSEPDIPLANSTIIQEVSIVDDSTLLLNVTAGISNELYDTVNISVAANSDTIYFSNSNHIIAMTNPVKFLRGFFVKNKIYIEHNLSVAPNYGNLYIYNGKKKII